MRTGITWKKRTPYGMYMLLVGGLAIGCAFMAGIGEASEPGTKGVHLEMITEGYNAQKNSEISNEEVIKEFLIRTFPGDDRAVNGDYSEKMKTVADQYLLVTSKMAEKYPSHDLKIIRCEPKSLLGSAYNIFYVTEDKDADPEGREVYVYENETADGRLSCEIEDAFIGTLMEPAYADYLLQNLQKTIPECYLVETRMTDVYGDEYDENLTPEEVMDGRNPMWNRTWIKADGSGGDADLILTRIKEYLETNTCCGSYHLVVTEGVDDEAAITKKDSLILSLKQAGKE